MTTLFSDCYIANNPGTDRVRASIKRILAGALLCLLCGSAFGQVRMAIEVTPNNPEPGERVVVRVTVTNAGSASVDDLQAQVDYPRAWRIWTTTFFQMEERAQIGQLAEAAKLARRHSGISDALPPGAGKTVYMSPADRRMPLTA